MQTTIPDDFWARQSQVRAHMEVFTVEEDYSQPSENVNVSQRPGKNKVTREACQLIIGFSLSFIMSLVLVSFVGWTSVQIYTWETKEEDTVDKAMWRYKDETTLCVTLQGKDLARSGCAKYLFHDIPDAKNYTCCVKDSLQYLLLYQMMILEQRRESSVLGNETCNHANANTEIWQNGTMVWTPALGCMLNGKTEESSYISIQSTQMYLIYLSIQIRYQESYRDLPNNRIRMSLVNRHTNLTSGDIQEEKLFRKSMKIRKERYSFDSIFFFGILKMRKNDRLYVSSSKKKYLYNHAKYSYMGVVNIHL